MNESSATTVKAWRRRGDTIRRFFLARPDIDYRRAGRSRNYRPIGAAGDPETVTDTCWHEALTRLYWRQSLRSCLLGKNARREDERALGVAMAASEYRARSRTPAMIHGLPLKALTTKYSRGHEMAMTSGVTISGERIASYWRAVMPWQNGRRRHAQ